MAYNMIYSLGAVPALYCSFGAVLGMLVQFWAEKPIDRRIHTPCAVAGCGLLLVYIGTQIAFWAFQVGAMIYPPLFMLLMAHPILYLILGLILSVAITKDAGAKETPDAEADPGGAPG